MRVLSNSTPSVSWRLNGLLRAREKAKAFAATSWSNPDGEGSTSEFTKWQPEVIGGPDDSAELAAQQLQDQREEPASEEQQAEVASQLEEQEALRVSEEALEQAKREAFEQGYQRGLDEGESQYGQARDNFGELSQGLRSAQQDMKHFYDPLKKLALHLAEQLVRGELSQSSAVIERLINEALKDLERQGEGPVVLYLNPEDKDKFSTSLDGELDSLDLRADAQLSQGSLRISIDDSAIEDLIEHRLDSLSQSLLGQPMANTRSSVFDSDFANPVEEKVIEGAVDESVLQESTLEQIVPEEIAPQTEPLEASETDSTPSNLEEDKPPAPEEPESDE